LRPIGIMLTDIAPAWISSLSVDERWSRLST